VVGKKPSFYIHICWAFWGANFPFYKVNNIFRIFLKTYTGKDISDESNSVYYLISKKIFVSIDKTTDCEGRYVTNVIVDILDKNTTCKLFLLTSEELDKVKYSTISKVFDQSVSFMATMMFFYLSFMPPHI